MGTLPHLGCCWSTAPRAWKKNVRDDALLRLLEDNVSSPRVAARLVTLLSCRLSSDEFVYRLPSALCEAGDGSAGRKTSDWPFFAAAATIDSGCLSHATQTTGDIYDDAIAELTDAVIPEITLFENPADTCPLESFAVGKQTPAPSADLTQTSFTMDAFELPPFYSLAEGVHAFLSFEKVLNMPITEPPPPSGRRSTTSSNPRSDGGRMSVASPRPGLASETKAAGLVSLGRYGPNGSGPTLSRRPIRLQSRKPEVNRRASAPAMLRQRQRPTEVVNLDDDEDEDVTMKPMPVPTPPLDMPTPGDEPEVIELDPASPTTPEPVLRSNDTTPTGVGRRSPAVRPERVPLSSVQRRASEKPVPNMEQYLLKLKRFEQRKRVEADKRLSSAEVKDISSQPLPDTGFARMQKRLLKKQAKRDSAVSKRDKVAAAEGRRENKIQKDLKRKKDAARRQRSDNPSGTGDEDDVVGLDDSSGDDDVELAKRRRVSPTARRTRSETLAAAQAEEGGSTIADFESRRKRLYKDVGEVAVKNVLDIAQGKLIDDWLRHETYMFSGSRWFEICLEREDRPGARVLRLLPEGVWNIDRRE